MKIGFIGLGNMGEGMSLNILKKHDDTVYVFDLVQEKVDHLAEQGAVPCGSAAAIAQNADIIITMLPRSEHVKGIYEELLPVADRGKIFVDMSTIDRREGEKDRREICGLSGVKVKIYGYGRKARDLRRL